MKNLLNTLPSNLRRAPELRVSLEDHLVQEHSEQIPFRIGKKRSESPNQGGERRREANQTAHR
ncbi:hypothetical protein LC612_42295 [Nostoc sp. CHAB 5834]|nr:hypothetical protein [Nostoc sp. CHAB 5834]